MEKKLEKILHTKTIMDSQFSVIIEEYRELGDNEVLEQIFLMANTLFSLAEQFGYSQFIEDEIYKFHPSKL